MQAFFSDVSSVNATKKCHLFSWKLCIIYSRAVSKQNFLASWQDSFTIIKPLACEFKNQQTRYLGVLFKRKKYVYLFYGLINSDYFLIILNERNIWGCEGG